LAEKSPITGTPYQWEWTLGAYDWTSSKNPVFRMITISPAGATMSEAISNQVASTGVWYHLVGIVNESGAAKIYINGVLRGTGASATFPTNNSQSMHFAGGYGSSNSWYTNGILDDIRLYSGVLSDEQILALYNIGIDSYYNTRGNCGSANGSLFYVMPTENLCSHGVPSTVSGTGPWTWTCMGESASVSCSANKGLLGFPMRKPVTVTSATAFSDYQLKMNISYDSDMQPDFDDLRFATGDGTLLPYWIESKTDSSSAVAWVKSNVVSGNNTIYMYYGNPSAVAASDGDSTFDFFDSFDGSSLNTSKWVQAATGNYTIGVSNSILALSTTSAGSSAHIRSNGAVGHIPIDRIVRAKAKTTHFVRSSSPNYKEYVYLIGGGGIYSSLFFAYDATYGKYFASNSGSGWNILGDITGWSANTWHTYELKRNGSTSLIKTVDDSYAQTLTSGIFTNNSYIAIQTGGTDSSAGCSQYYDWILVRKYASTEPTAVFGNEEVTQ
jgi:hypothetical protein